MADRPDDRVKTWVASVVEGVDVTLDPPTAQHSGQGIGLYLLDLMQSSSISTVKPPPLQLTLRYLVTAWAEQSKMPINFSLRLFFAAMENTDFDVERNPPPVELWRAFGVKPRPAFLLRSPLLLERPKNTAKLVRQPVKVQVISCVAFYGRVLGPGDTPLSNCLVQIPALGLSTSSDRQGRFTFRSLPSSGMTRLVIKARGHELSVNSDQAFPDSTSPMVIRFDSLED